MTRTLSEQEVALLRDVLAHRAEEDQNRLDNEVGDLSPETEGELRQRSRLCRDLQAMIEEAEGEVTIRIPGP